MTFAEAIEVLRPEAERWDETQCWHNPPFHDGRIYVTTETLHAISVVLGCVDGIESS